MLGREGAAARVGGRAGLEVVSSPPGLPARYHIFSTTIGHCIEMHFLFQTFYMKVHILDEYYGLNTGLCE